MKRLLLILALLLPSTAHAQIGQQELVGWSASATTANTNRDGSGTVYEIIRIRNDAGQFLKEVKLFPQGTNDATEAVLIATGPNGIGDTSDNFIIGVLQCGATTAGSNDISDVETFTLGVWLPKGYRVYGLVHATQAAGRQFVCFSSPTYQDPDP